MCVYVCMDVWMYGFLDDGIVYKDQSMDVFQLEWGSTNGGFTNYHFLNMGT